MRHVMHRSRHVGTGGATVSLLLMLLAIAAVALAPRQAARAGTDARPQHHGRDDHGDRNRDRDRDQGDDDSLADWQALWLAWFIGDVDIPPDDNGNADVGHLVLMPIPNAAGDGTPASVDVTLDAGQGFVLPLWSTYGFSYSDGTPNDPLVPLSVFKTLKFNFSIDGKTVIDHRNLMDYYSQTLFPPPGLPLDLPPADAIISLQCIGIVHGPLSPGKHTMTLDAVNTQALPPQYGGGFAEYHNTWDVTVKPGK
jgi:hypothetical protein